MPQPMYFFCVLSVYTVIRLNLSYWLLLLMFASLFIADIPLLPSISSLSAADDEETGSLFTVHWLNNKELHFTLAMEVFLQQLRGSLEQQNGGSNEGKLKY